MLPNSPEPPTRISPGGEYNPATLTVRIDKREPIPWPHKPPVRINELSLSDRHLIVLTSDGKRIQSFWFRFADYKDAELCMYFDGYQVGRPAETARRTLGVSASDMLVSTRLANPSSSLRAFRG